MLEARKIGVSIQGLNILSGLSAVFSSGEICLITGKNGSGKTILLEILAGLRKPSTGAVFLNSNPYPQKGKQLGIEVGLLFQQAEMQIIEQTVEDDILFGLKNLRLSEKERQKCLHSVLEWSGLSKHRQQYPPSLSGGEQRCLALAGVIALSPKFILLDEPFENLDFPSVRSIIKIILELKAKGHGIILVCHDLEKCLAHVDRLMVLNKGKIIINAHPKDALATIPNSEIRIPPMELGAMSWL